MERCEFPRLPPIFVFPFRFLSLFFLTYILLFWFLTLPLLISLIFTFLHFSVTLYFPISQLFHSSIFLFYLSYFFSTVNYFIVKFLNFFHFSIFQLLNFYIFNFLISIIYFFKISIFFWSPFFFFFHNSVFFSCILYLYIFLLFLYFVFNFYFSYSSLCYLNQSIEYDSYVDI